MVLLLLAKRNVMILPGNTRIAADRLRLQSSDQEGSWQSEGLIEMEAIRLKTTAEERSIRILIELVIVQELEYPDGHVSRSVHVAMPLVGLGDKVPEGVRSHLEGASLAIWTTTPWTMPANAAVAVNADLQYAIVQVEVRDHTLCALAEVSAASSMSRHRTDAC